VWDGNEVWLLAGGGTLYFAFPLLYASAFSGFYLPLMIVLWLLILRGVSLELRNHIEVGVWRSRCWTASSDWRAPCSPSSSARPWPTCCAACRCRPTATSFCPCGPTGSPASHPGILDWYTVIGGLVALVALTMHGALWLAIKTSGELAAARPPHRDAALAAAGGAHRRQPRWPPSPCARQPEQLLQLPGSRSLCPWAWWRRWPASGSESQAQPVKAFLCSCLYLFFMLAGACWGLYPTLLPATTGADRDITLSRALSGPHTLAVGLVWWAFGMALAVSYVVFVYSKFRGKVEAGITSQRKGPEAMLWGL
jgi:cytochrome d ubiquinol oxidase subunit II